MWTRLLCALPLWFSAASHADSSPPPVEVLVLGTFHMANPGADLMNVQVDDVLTAKRQSEILATVEALAAFKPDKIALEDRQPDSDTLEIAEYADYLAGKLDQDRNENVQLGYRLAALLKHRAVYGVDVAGDLDFDSVFKFAAEHGLQGLVDRQMQLGQKMVGEMQQHLEKHSIGAQLYWLNDPLTAVRDHGFYGELLKIGNRREQPGARLMADWVTRNIMICGRLVQISEPGDRIVLMFGNGHSFLLRQCVQQTPGFKLIEARDWLPAGP